MKNYKKVTLVAKNASVGSYAAGCPEKTCASICTSCEVNR